MRELHNQGLPSQSLRPALEKVLGNKPMTTKNVAGALTKVLNSPNSLVGTTYVPVKLPSNADPKLVARYLRSGLLRKGSDGKMYALFRSPDARGSDPQHNRVLGRNNAMAKGTGVFAPHEESVGKSKEKAKLVLFHDAGEKKWFHRFQGALTKGQAQKFTDENYQTLYASLKEVLKDKSDPKLHKLIKKHHITTNIVPQNFLSLRIEALPVAPQSEKAKAEILGTKSATVKVSPELAKKSPGLTWVKTRAYWKLFSGNGEIEKPAKAMVQLYTTNHPALRLGKVVDHKEHWAAPAIQWGRKYTPATAAVRIAFWQRTFNDYGWELRQGKDGAIRVHDKKSGQLITAKGDALKGAKACASTVAEGNAVITGVMLKALWRKRLSSAAYDGGNPFLWRNCNGRCRLDLDTIGPEKTFRTFIPGDRKLTLRDSRLIDLHWKEGRNSRNSAVGQAKMLAKALGVGAEQKRFEKIVQSVAGPLPQ